MLKIFFPSFAVLVLLAAIVAGIIFGAKNITVPVTRDRYETCLDDAAVSHEPQINCSKIETLYERGFEDPVAYYTFWLALLTVALAVGGFMQSVLIGRQISLARDEFNATHRPAIEVRNMTLDDQNRRWARFGEELKGQITIANTGSTDATIVASHIGAYWSDVGLPSKPLYDDSASGPFVTGIVTAGAHRSMPFKSGKLEIGYGLTGTFESTDPQIIATQAEVSVSDLDEQARDLQIFYIMGWIRFKDGRGVERQMGFCRRWDAHARELIRVNNLDYEYGA